MKKNLSIILILTMMTGVFGCSNISAAISSDTQEVITEVTGSTAMVSVRDVLEELDYDINWESTSKTLYGSRKKNVISITVDSDIAELNGEKIKMNGTAAVENGALSITAASMAMLTGEEITDSGEVITGEEVSDESRKENKADVDLSSVDGNTYTITETGVYTLSGDYNGMIYVNCDGKVKLILNGVNITNESGPAIFFENSKKGIIEAEENTVNTLTDGSEYNVDAKGCIFSNDDLDIQGSGTINITANYNHGISSDDDIKIEDTSFNITTAVGDGIHAKDGVNIKSGNIVISSMGDAISGDKYVEINDGEVNITTRGEIDEGTNNDMPGGGFNGERSQREPGTGTDGDFEMPQNFTPDNMGEKNEMPEDNAPIAMEERREIPKRAQEGNMDERPEMPPVDNEMNNGERPEGKNGDMPRGQENVVEESTEETTEDESISSKGIKSDRLITVNGGEININSTDHCIKSDNLIVINGGNINVESDISKGMKALGCLFINDGEINIDTKDEGIESKATVTINGGNINIKSDDDGINAGGGSGATMMNNVQDGDEYQVVINGGKVYIDSRCDGIDSNGNLYFYGGEVVIDGPTSGGDGALDSGAQNVLYGGTVFAVGSAGMAECPESGGDQNILNITFDSSNEAGSSVVIMEDNTAIYEAIASKEFQNLIFSSDMIKEGKEYSIYINGEKTATVTTEKGVTKYGNERMNNRGGFGGGRRNFNPDK